MKFLGWLIALVIVALLLMEGNWKPFEQGFIWLFLWKGLQATLEIAFYAMGLSFAIGVLFAVGRLSKFLPLSLISTCYIEFFRALPLYLVILYLYLALPKLAIPISPFWAAVIGLTLYNSAIMAEIVRAGILSIERGQREAALSLGLSRLAIFRYIILPQALRRMMPALVSQLITLLKDTSLAAIIALPELTRQGRIIYNQYGNVLETMFVVAMIYFVFCYSLSLVSRRLEVAS